MLRVYGNYAYAQQDYKIKIIKKLKLTFRERPITLGEGGQSVCQSYTHFLFKTLFDIRRHV